jgi:hypothetical protein
VDLRAAEPAAVDDAGVILGIAVDGISRADQRRDRADIGGVAGRKQQRRLGSLERRERLLQLRMKLTAASDQRARPRAPTAVLHDVERRLQQPRIGGQAEVIIAAEVDELLPFILDLVPHLRPHAHGKLAAQRAFLQLDELLIDPTQRVGHGGSLRRNKC